MVPWLSITASIIWSKHNCPRTPCVFRSLTRLWQLLTNLHQWQTMWPQTIAVTRSHYNDVIISTMAYHITSLTIVYSIVYSDADQRKHQSFASLASVWGIHRWPVNSPHKGPVTRKMFPFFYDVIMARDSSPDIAIANCDQSIQSHSQGALNLIHRCRV